MDALWMRVEKGDSLGEAVFARMAQGKILITIDRGDYWQCAYIVPKGHYDELKKRGYFFKTNLESGIIAWLRDEPAGEFI